MYKTVRLDRNHHASFTDATSHYQWNIMKPKSSFMNFALSSVKKVAFPPVPRIQRWAWGGRRESPKKWKCRSSAAVSWLQTGADRLLGKSPWAIQSWIHRARPSPRQQQVGLMPDPFVTIGLQNWGFKWGLSAWNLAAISAPYSYVGHFVFRLGASMNPQIRSYLSIEAYLPSGIQTWRRRIPYYRWEFIAGKIIYGRLSIAIATLNPFAGSNLMLIRPIPSCSMLFHNLKLNLFPIIIQYPPRNPGFVLDLFVWAVAKTPMSFSSNPTCLPRCFRDHSFSFRGWLASWFCFRGASAKTSSSWRL